jgi:GTP-binding protein
MTHDSGAITRAMFIDEAEIIVAGGAGGNGCIAFRREKFIPKGGPGGGDGGDGGSVIIEADDSFNTLQHLAGHHHWLAKRGEHGLGSNCSGKRGLDVIVKVPPGTIIYDAQTGGAIKDITTQGQRFVIAVGGKGGHGNTFFKTSINQAPRQAELGTPGQERKLRLELKLIADAGLLGKPNAGKSTLLSRLSSARPKIAAYPFTTLFPCLGIVELSGFRRFVMADIPGLIEGAHSGAGLGDEFLRHVERTTLLVHIIDVCPPEGDPFDDYQAIRRELKKHSPALAKKPEIIVANKMDLTDSKDSLKRLEKKLGKKILPISAVTGTGLDVVVEQIWDMLHPRKD